MLQCKTCKGGVGGGGERRKAPKDRLSLQDVRLEKESSNTG